MGDVSEETQDFAIEAWHEDGRWSVASLPDPDDLTHIINRLNRQQTNGGAVALIAIDDEFFLAIRVLGSHTKYFISDVLAVEKGTQTNEIIGLIEQFERQSTVDNLNKIFVEMDLLFQSF